MRHCIYYKFVSQNVPQCGKNFKKTKIRALVEGVRNEKMLKSYV